MEEAVAHHRLVAAEAVEGQVGQSAGLPDADAVLDSGVAPMAQLESRVMSAPFVFVMKRVWRHPA